MTPMGPLTTENTIFLGVEKSEDDLIGADGEHPKQAGSHPHALAGSQLDVHQLSPPRTNHPVRE